MLVTGALLVGFIAAVLGVVMGVGFGLAAARVVNDSVVLTLSYDTIALVESLTR